MTFLKIEYLSPKFKENIAVLSETFTEEHEAFNLIGPFWNLPSLWKDSSGTGGMC